MAMAHKHIDKVIMPNARSLGEPATRLPEVQPVTMPVKNAIQFENKELSVNKPLLDPVHAPEVPSKQILPAIEPSSPRVPQVPDAASHGAPQVPSVPAPVSYSTPEVPSIPAPPAFSAPSVPNIPLAPAHRVPSALQLSPSQPFTAPPPQVLMSQPSPQVPLMPPSSGRFNGSRLSTYFYQ